MFTSTLSFYLPVSVGPILSPNNLSLISYLFNVCVCMFICVQGVCRSICSCMQGHLEVRGWSKPWNCSSDAVSIMCFEMGSVTGLEFTKWARLAEQRVPEIHLSVPLRAKRTSVCPHKSGFVFVCVLETELRSSCLHSRCFTDRAISAAFQS